MDIRDVLEIISQKSGLPIGISANSQGKATLYLKNVEMRDVLKIILDMNNLAYHFTASAADGAQRISVMTKEEFQLRFGYPFGQKTQSRVIPLLYTKTSDLLEALDQMKSPLGKVINNDQINTLVLMDTPDVLASMVSVLSEWDVPVETKTFVLKYVKAQETALKLQESLTKNIGKIQFNAQDNSLTVTDSSLKLKEIERVIRAIDKSDKEVFFRIKVLRIVLNEEHKKGIDWEAIVSDYRRLDVSGGEEESVSSAGGEDHPGGLSLGTVSEEDYAVLLEALDTVGLIYPVSDTEVTRPLNEDAEMLVKQVLDKKMDESLNDRQREGFATGHDDEASQGGLGGRGEEKRDVKFHITPTMAEGDVLDIRVEPEFDLTSLPNNALTAVGEQGNPVTAISSVPAVSVKIPKGATLVIGGLHQKASVELVRKIPFLGDLPLLGFAFRNQGQRIQKTETIIFLTPKITERGL